MVQLSYMSTVSYTLRIPEELLSEIDSTAALLGISRAQVVIKRLEGGPVDCRYVYLMRKGALHKIGISRDPDVRKTQVGSGVELIWCQQSPLAASMELAYHAHFAEKRKHGEWFDLSPEDIKWLKEVDLHHPRQGDFVSSGVSCKCHPPKFTKTSSWRNLEWVRCSSSRFQSTNLSAGAKSASEDIKSQVQTPTAIPISVPETAKLPMSTNSTKPDMDALRVICAGVIETPVGIFVTDERVAPGELRIGSHDGPVLVENIGCPHEEWAPDGEKYRCRLAAGHKGKCVPGERVEA